MPHAKKEDIFYTMLKEFAGKVEDAAELYDTIILGYPDTYPQIPRMHVCEHECDEMVKRIMTELYRAFVTPFDRGDISSLALAMDDIVDNMDGVIVRLDLFNLGETRREAPQVAELSLHAAREFRVMIDHLPDYKNDPVVMEKAIAIGNIENEGDDVYHSALFRLFHEESEDARATLAWLRLFDRMEMGMDAFDKAAGVVRSVVMKSA